MATFTFGMVSNPFTGSKAFTSSDADMVSLLQWASAAYQGTIQAGPAADAVFTGSITNNVLTVTAVASGGLAINQVIYASNSSIAPGTYIASLGTGSGGLGTYNLSTSPLGNPSVPSKAMSAYGIAKIGLGLAQGTMNAWIVAEQKFAKDGAVFVVPTPPPMGWV